MAVYSFQTKHILPVSLDVAWEFFSNPANLVKITPTSLDFKIISKYHGDKMYPGQIIEYKVRPLFRVPVYWMTEITHVEEKVYFIDEQRFGPYSLWHHQHHFKSVSEGVEMTDIVHYKPPMGILGDLANSLFIKKELQRIFKHRGIVVEELFKGSL